jgi:PAS domain S-box-containing protein
MDDASSIFAGDGCVRLLLRAYDWSQFPFGAPERWPPLIRRTIGMVLAAEAPMSFFWGPQQLYFYNDAYLAVLADKHPAALGRPFWESWLEVQEAFSPVLNEALAGKACNLSDVRFRLQRNGLIENAYFTYSLLPIFDADGAVIGILNPAVETTDAVMMHRGQEFQLQLSDQVRGLAGPSEVIAKASEMLGQYLGVGRVAYASVDEAGVTVNVAQDWNNGSLPPIPNDNLYLDDFGPLIAGLVREGKPLILPDVKADPRSAAFAAAYERFGVRAVLALPLMKGGRLRALLNVNHGEVRHWTRADLDVVVGMLDRTWSAAESAHAQCALRRERDQTSYIFDSMTEGFALLDKDWRVVRMNAEGLRLTQQSGEQVIGRSHWELWPDLAGSEVERLYRQVMADRQSALIEIPYALHGHERIWMEVRAHPALEGGLALFFRNITARKQVEEQLKDADRRKDEFLAMLAHELRNPLAPIGAAAELLQIAKLDEARIRQTSQIIGRQVRHMTSLIDDLLDVSRVTRGLVELQLERLDIHHVVTEAIEQITPLIRRRRQHLALELTPHPALIEGDRKRLVQVLSNLLNNAAKYTQEEGHITLTTGVHEEQVLVHITDDGIGMAPDLAARAFELFTQAERSSDRSLGGLGVGLALVKSLVELHGGTARCESAGQGLGSRFTVCLPRIGMGEGALTAAPDAAAARRNAGRRLRIMVVDDNVDAAATLALLLESHEHEVTVAHHAYEALERCKADPPDVVLLDIGLPDIDGIEVARRLRLQPETANTMLIAVTGYGLPKDIEATTAAGFDHHLVKPVDLEKLCAILTT